MSRRTPKSLFAHFMLLLASVALASCASSYKHAAPPEVRVIGLSVLPSSTLLDQQFEVTLAVGNPNDFDFPLDGLRFALDINGERFASGYGGEPVLIPRFGEARVKVLARTDVVKIVRQIMALGRGQEINYNIAGDAFLGGRKRPLPFARAGRVSLTP